MGDILYIGDNMNGKILTEDEMTKIANKFGFELEFFEGERLCMLDLLDNKQAYSGQCNWDKRKLEVQRLSPKMTTQLFIHEITHTLDMRCKDIGQRPQYDRILVELTAELVSKEYMGDDFKLIAPYLRQLPQQLKTVQDYNTIREDVVYFLGNIQEIIEGNEIDPTAIRETKMDEWREQELQKQLDKINFKPINDIHI